MLGDRKKLAIIDGKSVFYRGYYAMGSLSTNDGIPTGGVYGFASMALEVIKKLQPDYFCVAWDKPKTNIRRRKELYPEYKAGRKPPPDDFYAQIPILRELLDAFDWPLYEFDDYEADDIMGTLAVKASEQNIETFLITSDLDMLQLVNPLVHVYALKKGLSNIELFDPESFVQKYGINPSQFLDLKSLMGDSSDNIPGVPGIGKKGAVDLLKEHETLDGIYDNLALIKDSHRKKLEKGKDLAYLSKQLADIWTDAPVEFDEDALDASNCDPAKISKILQRLEFRSLVRQLPEAMRLTGSQEINSYGAEIDNSHVIIDNQEDLSKLKLNNSENVIVHARCAGKHGKDPSVLIISPSEKLSYVLIVEKLQKANLKETLSGIKSVIGYDVKATQQVFIELGVNLPAVKHDVLVGAFLIDSLRRERTLSELAEADLGYGKSLDNLPTDELVERSGELVAIIRMLHGRQVKALEDLPKVAKLASGIEWPVINTLAHMEHEGIKLDVSYLRDMSDRLADHISDTEQQIYGYADQEFNISSPSQLADVLFVKMQLPTQGIKKGKTGYSTAASELDKLRPAHPIIDLITHYREYTKLKNTYVDTLPTMVDEHSRVHTTFNLTVAQTGRLSSIDPNLQNIPVRTDLGREIRTAFVAREGNVLVSADYSQFELRLAAYLAGDEELIEMFNNGLDVHTLTAAQVYNREPDEVSKQMRRDAKVINFGVLYGMSPHGLSAATGMDFVAAKKFIDKYFELRKPLLDYINNLKDKAHSEGYVETLFGRRRPTPDVKSSNYIVRQGAERAAINMPIQGTEADLMKMAMVKVDVALADTSARQLLQIHDSILVECAQEDGDKVAKLLKETMESVHELPVQLTVDVTIGKNWGEL